MPHPRAETQVDNSHLTIKSRLRVEAVEKVGTPAVRVLDAYAGLGALWRHVRDQTDVQVSTVGIDKRPDAPREVIHGDNRRVLRSLDLSRFDLIDLDAYGVPAEQLAIVAERAPATPVFVTCIHQMRGRPPTAVLRRLGIPPAWANQTQTAIMRLGWLNLWDGYCAALGYRRRRGYTLTEGGSIKRYDLLTR